LAYKGVKKEGLQKLLDKRAIGNDELYQKLENEVKSIVNKMDLKKVEADNK